MNDTSRDGPTEVMRSKLFVPADRPAFFPKALASAADAICFDLEDSVLPAQKAQARRYLREFLATDFHTRKAILVRVNHVRSADFAEDLSAAVFSSVSVLVLPKVEDAAEIQEAVAALLALEKMRGVEHRIAILPTIETPGGVRLAESIASADARVVGLQLGLADLFESLGIEQNDREAAHHVRLQLRLAAGEAGIACFDSAYSNFKDEEGFLRESQMARGLGFDGKSCIHPDQIQLANRIFSPTPEEIVAAERCVEAARAATTGGLGAFALDGRMIDAPFVRRAESILQFADKIRMLETDGKEE